MLCELVEDVAEVEFWDHQEALRLGIFHEFVPWAVANRVFDLPTLNLAFIALVVLQESLDWQVIGHRFLCQEVNAVKLERKRALLSNGQDLEPGETSDIVQHLGYLEPFSVTERLTDVDLKTVDLANLRFLLLLVLELLGR